MFRTTVGDRAPHLAVGGQFHQLCAAAAVELKVDADARDTVADDKERQRKDCLGADPRFDQVLTRMGLQQAVGTPR